MFQVVLGSTRVKYTSVGIPFLMSRFEIENLKVIKPIKILLRKVWRSRGLISLHYWLTPSCGVSGKGVKTYVCLRTFSIPMFNDNEGRFLVFQLQNCKDPIWTINISKSDACVYIACDIYRSNRNVVKRWPCNSVIFLIITIYRER